MEDNMTLVEKIMQAVSENPNLSAAEISQATGGSPNTVKVELTKLAKNGKIARDKAQVNIKRKGPQMEYVYRPV